MRGPLSSVSIVAAAALAAALTPWASERFSGTCVAVRDGDTIEVMRAGRAVRVRLWGIDCPERGQPFGRRARQFTSELALGKEVTVEVVEQDRYGRIVGRVSVAGEDVGLRLVREGLAWWYEPHAPRAGELAAAQREARTARRGLWSDPQPVPPADWRRRRSRGRRDLARA